MVNGRWLMVEEILALTIYHYHPPLTILILYR